MVDQTAADEVRRAADRTLARGSGRIEMLGRTADDEVVMVTELDFDGRARRGRLRQRFAVGDEETSTWHVSVVDGDRLLVEQIDTPTWAAVDALWPSSSPLAMVHWLRGAVAAPSPGDGPAAGGSALEVAVDPTQALDRSTPEDLAGVRRSLEEAGLDAPLPVRVTLGPDGLVATLRVQLPGDDALVLDLTLSGLGRPVTVDVPSDVVESTPEEVVERAVRAGDDEEPGGPG